MEHSSPKTRPPTLHDVAVAAGVTNATASRSLTGAYGVHPDTRKRVHAIAVQLNYKANSFARTLATGRSDLIGLIVSDIRNSYFAEVARGAEDAAFNAGLDIMICNSDLNASRQMRYFNSLMERRVQGIIMNSVANLSREDQTYIANSRVPVVLLNRPPRATVFSSVSADNERGGELAAECLLKHGHHRVIHLTGPEKHANLSARARGFVRTVRRFGSSAEVSVLHGTHTLTGGYDMAKAIFRDLGNITGISTASDTVAFGVIKAAIEMGLRIPEDISIIGFDDVEFAALVHPPLTTIRQPKYEIGRAAIDAVLRLSDREDRIPEHHVLGVELIERSSVGRPPGSEQRHDAALSETLGLIGQSLSP